MEAGKSKIYSVGGRLATQKELMVQLKSKGHLLENFLLLEKSQHFISTQALNWLDEAHLH